MNTARRHRSIILGVMACLAASAMTTQAQYVEATGGDQVYMIFTNGNAYWVHKFTTAGSSNFVVSTGGDVEYLIVGGGGGVGAVYTLADNRPGGGGAGGLLTNTQTITAGTYPVVVGAGGAAANYNSGSGNDGNPSSALGQTASGGGHGGNWTHDANPGGSGGAGGASLTTKTLAAAGTAGQGNDGGAAFTNDTVCAGGGGGGAGGPGQDAYLDGATINGGDGGPGLSSDLDGTLRWYAGGGGGASYGGVGGSGGIGGGGNGQATTGTLGWNSAAAANTGGGGGGHRGGSGGSGVVIIRYMLDPSAPLAIVAPFTLSHPVTGSTTYTGTNTVEVSNLPDPVEVGATYDRYQITESDAPGSIDPGGWKVRTAPYDAETFTEPGSDGAVTLYAWYTNASQDVKVQRASGSIIYTTVAPPDPPLATLAARETAGFSIRVTGDALDNGATGGTYGGNPIGIYRLIAQDTGGNSHNLTAGEIYFTVNGAGSYPVTLKVINMAGNVTVASGSRTLNVSTTTSLPTGTAGDLFVAAGNLNAASPFDTWTKAAARLQDAVDDPAADGATIWVAPEVYYGTNDWQLAGPPAAVVSVAKQVTVRSAVGRASTMINGYGLRRGASLNHVDAVMDGFTITNCYVTDGTDGAGASVIAGTLRNCLIAGNSITNANGGGAFLRYQGVIDNCDVLGNHAAGTGGGIYLLGTANQLGPRVVNCRIRNNTATVAGGIGLYAGRTFISNCIVSGNTAGNVGGIQSRGGGGHRIANSLIYANAGADGAGVGAAQGSMTIENCTIAYNTGWGLNSTFQGGDFYVTNSISYFNSAGAWDTVGSLHVVRSCGDDLSTIDSGFDNITDDPAFKDTAADDYRLKSSSPCVNTGTNLPWMVEATDLMGNPRIDSGTVDRGCYEFVTVGTTIMIQ